MSDIKWTDTALYRATETIEVNAASISSTITPTISESDCTALKLLFDFTLNPSLYLSNYSPKVLIKVEVKYKGEDYQDDNCFVVVNRGTKEAIIELKGQDIQNLSFQIINNSSSTISFSKFEVYESVDVSPIQAGRLFETDAIQAKVIKTASFFTEGLFVQMLLTNAMSRSVRLAKPGDEVNYILIEGWEIGFYTAILGEEQEQFTITTTIAGTPTTHTYWYQTIEGDLAYQPITEIDPRETHPNISDSDREKFKYMVYKPTSVSKKMSVEFALNANGNYIPTFRLGAGTDELGTGNGQGFIFKDETGLHFVYQKSNGEKCGFICDEDGTHAFGWAPQHCETIEFCTNGVELQWVGEEKEYHEYVEGDSGLTGIIMNSTYLTTIKSSSRAVGTKS